MNWENYDPSFPDQPVVDLYLPVWAKLPASRSKPAFVWVDGGIGSGGGGGTASTTLTYSQLNDSARSISLQLLLPLQRGDTVIVLCPPGLELIEIIFGCQRAGLVSIPMLPPDPSFAKESHSHLTRALSQTKPKAAIAPLGYITRVNRYVSPNSVNRDEKFAAMLQNLRWISTEEIGIKTNEKLGPSAPSPSSCPYNGCKPEDVYLIQYTSGATGIPKPVLVTAGSAAHNVRAARKAYDLHPNSMITSWLPQYHDCGLMFLLLTIVSGATCVLTSPPSFLKRPRLWLELITDFRATCTPVPSFTLPLVVRRGGVERGTSPINLVSMKNLIIINEPIYRGPVDEFVDAFAPFGLNPSSLCPSYGLAENCTFVSTAWRPTSHDLAAFPNIPTHNKLLPSARLASTNDDSSSSEEDMQIVVVDEETLAPVQDGTEGEIWVSSPSNGSGYLGHPSLTRETFHARLSNKVSSCFLRTGDRGVVKGVERFLYVTGRCSDIIPITPPNDIETSSRAHHAHYLETAAYDAFPQFLRGGCIAAFECGSRRVAVIAELQRSEGLNGDALRGLCEGVKDAILNREKVEVGLVVLAKSGSVPKTTSGKLQRWLAKARLVGGEMDVAMEMEFGLDDNGGSWSSFTTSDVNGSAARDGGRGKRSSSSSPSAVEVSGNAGGERFEREIASSLTSSDSDSTRPKLLSML
ncbi:LOW QUALITY PROTEIN: long-chain-fatty-acid--AMP ligase FadD26-like [Rhodamnia argentea]|uniref:LOW QUALITY PROTEIN: long-chain-fatty-acid--AMP ligase FadD26-like n=1 Tax=Rhodamnia argentea TaxID=178133 RepID=A0A8B8NXL4_9MYRT|nr:LOW QUALITY PROTEIN: long-chain-fatty-acid--AMP ligase FadD26-like [Rhodamnia argentea]